MSPFNTHGQQMSRVRGYKTSSCHSHNIMIRMCNLHKYQNELISNNEVFDKHIYSDKLVQPRHEISNNVVWTTSKASYAQSDQNLC